MALQVWLPLISDAHNQGLTGTTFTNNNVTFGGTGKLGTSAVFNGSNGAIYADGINVGNAWTVCCWAKMANAGTYSLFQLGKSANYSNSQFLIHTVSSNTKQIYRICNGNSSGGISMSVDYTDWIHYCLTYDGTTCIIYINGTKLIEHTVTAPLISGTRLAIGAYYGTGVLANGMIQDFRLYDTPLSPREVKEIAKGLVLHYPLSMPGQENLLLNTATPVSWITTYTREDEWDVKDIYNMESPVNQLFEANDTATFSFDWKFTPGSSGSITGHFHLETGNVTPWILGSVSKSTGTRNNASNYIDLSATNTSGHVTCTFIVSSSAASAADTFRYFRIRWDKTPKDGTLKLSNCKLERGEIATPWIPNPADTAYSTLGFSDGVEYDVSGYQHNGTKTGTFTYDVSTPRYNTSTVFSGSNHIAVGRLPITDELTYSWWGYSDNWGSSLGGSMVCSVEGGGMGHQNGGSTYLWFICGTGTSSNDYGSGYQMPTPSAGWHMFTETWDGYRFKVYLDGELKNTNERYTTKTPVYYSQNYNFLFLGGESGGSATTPEDHFIGKLSDARVYATALSASDILELYHTPITLANNGVLMTQGEFEES